jgi:single stranded DNA-binding protein
MNVCHITVSGRVTKDASIITTEQGNDLTRFSLARNRKNWDGEEVAEFYSCSWFGTYAKKASESLKKGAKVVVEGDFMVRPYTREDGEDAFSLDVNVNSCDVLSAQPHD